MLLSSETVEHVSVLDFPSNLVCRAIGRSDHIQNNQSFLQQTTKNASSLRDSNVNNLNRNK